MAIGYQLVQAAKRPADPGLMRSYPQREIRILDFFECDELKQPEAVFVADNSLSAFQSSKELRVNNE